MNKQIVIIQDMRATLIPHAEYLEFSLEGRRRMIAYRHIRALYLYDGVHISLKVLVKIATKVPLFIVDRYGVIGTTVTPYTEGDNETA